MNTDLEIVEVKKSFRDKIEVRASKPHGRKRIMALVNTTYPTINRLIRSGFVRKGTLKEFVKTIEGENANVEDYIIF